MAYVFLLGRIMFAAIFLAAVPRHFTSEASSHAADLGVPLSKIAVPLSGIISLLGGLSVMLGYQTRVGAWLLVAFLAPVTLMMHGFWKVKDPIQLHVQQAMFMKNVSMLGAALLIAWFGGGPLSLDSALGL